MQGGDDRPRRQDSVRNRERLIAAAREVFATRGFEATLDDIAHHAGLGTGTAYRHFPNKQAIAAVVLAEATQQIVLDAQLALHVADPWAAIELFFERAGAQQAADRGLYETLRGQGNDEEQARIWPEIIAAVSELFDRGQRAGVIRADAAPQDIAVIFALLGPVFELSRSTGLPLWRRYLALLLDGLRATKRTALPVPAPPAEALDAILRAGKRSPTGTPPTEQAGASAAARPGTPVAATGSSGRADQVAKNPTRTARNPTKARRNPTKG